MVVWRGGTVSVGRWSIARVTALRRNPDRYGYADLVLDNTGPSSLGVHGTL